MCLIMIMKMMIKFVNVLFGEDEKRILFESCTKNIIPKSDKWSKLFYVNNNNITKFVFEYSTNKHINLWNMLK